MNQYAQMIRQLKSPDVMKQLNLLYGQREGMMVAQTTRYAQLLKRHEELVNTESAVFMISAPGRTEIGGNHTDHNRGKVLAAAVNLDTLAAVTSREDGIVNVYSEGYPAFSLSLDDLNMRQEEKGTTAALIRGVAARMKELDYVLGGFDAVITSTVRGGSGLSSSAAFEVLTCSIFDQLYNHNTLSAKLRAQISQYAENVYFGKPSGLLDQMASSVGGLAFIDFKEDDPLVKALSYDFSAKGYALVVVNSGGSHDDLTEFYAAIPQEMRAVAKVFGEENLRRVSPEQFSLSLPMVREKLEVANKERAILRASHFFAENRRVADETSALQHDDLPEFFRLIIESGRSSYCYLQNVFATPEHQELALALMLSEQKLTGKGAWRVHGGGFAGTTLNFVPQKQLASYVREMEAVFGQHSCDVLDIRPVGPATIVLGK
ncbi:MAG: galactokinase family protein [Eubacteriales bacterium]|nr:galactokinase family protein [Eubacteriales bacterium]